MGEVRNFRRGWSISWLAEQFGMDRKTVSKRIREAGIPPTGKDGGYDVYSLADVATVLVDPIAAAPGGVIDPRDLPPKDRKDFYQSEQARLQVETTMGALVPALEVEAQLAEIVKTAVQFLETLPDVLERKLSLSADQVIKVQERCDHVRQQMYDKIMQGESHGDLRDSA